MPRVKHSPRLGQRASSQTGWSAFSRSRTRTSRVPRARGLVVRAQSGSRAGEGAPSVGGVATLLLDDEGLELVVAQAVLRRHGVGAVAVDTHADREAAAPPDRGHRVGRETPGP